MERSNTESFRHSQYLPFSPTTSSHPSTPLAQKHASLPIPTPTTASSLSGSASTLRYSQSRKTIYDRHLNRSKGAELSKASFAFLFGEMVQYAQKRVSGIQDLEKKLNAHGYSVGQRLLELLVWREGRSGKRETRVLGILQFITNTLWRAIYNKPADALEKSRDHEDEYMISDNDPMVNTYISVPKEMNQLNCAAFQAGIIEAVLDSCMFPARVTAHSVPNETWPGKTVFLIKFEQVVLDREAEFIS
ncbi:NO signaling/Golgi transport ligand-binding domain-containing protein [Terfezia claveryi]|nr:NO signaling/Golgi transport ligand-binding domain-containing protein [Terfezia claveryi]